MYVLNASNVTVRETCLKYQCKVAKIEPELGPKYLVKQLCAHLLVWTGEGSNQSLSLVKAERMQLLKCNYPDINEGSFLVEVLNVFIFSYNNPFFVCKFSIFICVCSIMFYFFFFLWPCCLCATYVCVCCCAHKSAPPCGWHLKCIITINEKVNGAFSYISIYIWLFGCTNDVWAVATNATLHRNRGLMCFCGHQMLWIMTRPLNANQMTLDRPRSTVPAWKFSPTDTLKREENRESCHQEDKHFSIALHLSDMM